MAGKKGQRHRFWSDEEKRSVCVQASVPGISIAQVARRYSMNTNLIHKWLKDPRFAPVRDEDCAQKPMTFCKRYGCAGLARIALFLLGSIITLTPVPDKLMLHS